MSLIHDLWCVRRKDTYGAFSKPVDRVMVRQGGAGCQCQHVHIELDVNAFVSGNMWIVYNDNRTLVEDCEGDWLNASSLHGSHSQRGRNHSVNVVSGVAWSGYARECGDIGCGKIYRALWSPVLSLVTAQCWSGHIDLSPYGGGLDQISSH